LQLFSGRGRVDSSWGLNESPPLHHVNLIQELQRRNVWARLLLGQFLVGFLLPPGLFTWFCPGCARRRNHSTVERRGQDPSVLNQVLLLSIFHRRPHLTWGHHVCAHPRPSCNHSQCLHARILVEFCGSPSGAVPCHCMAPWFQCRAEGLKVCHAWNGDVEHPTPSYTLLRSLSTTLFRPWKPSPNCHIAMVPP